MQQVVVEQPMVAHAVRCLPLYDVLELTLELLRQHGWPEFGEPESLPPNVIRFRPHLRRSHQSAQPERGQMRSALASARRVAEPR
jgi:hypothetical protein